MGDRKELTAAMFIGVGGDGMISFGSGQPDLPPPREVYQILPDYTGFKYGLVQGQENLREALARQYPRSTAESFVITNGASEALDLALRSIAWIRQKKGDHRPKCLLCRPYYYSYLPLVRYAGFEPVFTDLVDGRIVPEDFQAKVRDCRVVLINSPSNPTGMVFDRKELEKIAALCVEHDMVIVSDDIYRKLVFDGSEFFSVATISPEVAKRTFIIDGPSKTYAMTGWRIGYCIGDAEVIKAMSRLQSQSTSNPTSFAQKGAVASLTGDQAMVEERRKIFQRRRDLIVSKLREVPGFSIIPPEGSFYAFPSIEGWVEKFGGSSALTSYLLENALVAVVPGEEFGAPDHLRLSFATSEENITAGIDRIKEALARL